MGHDGTCYRQEFFTDFFYKNPRHKKSRLS